MSIINNRDIIVMKLTSKDEAGRTIIRETITKGGISALDLFKLPFPEETKVTTDPNFLNRQVNSEEIEEGSKIYFSKNSKFPRHKVRNFTDLKRTILPDNADYILTEDILQIGKLNSYYGASRYYHISNYYNRLYKTYVSGEGVYYHIDLSDISYLFYRVGNSTYWENYISTRNIPNVTTENQFLEFLFQFVKSTVEGVLTEIDTYIVYTNTKEKESEVDLLVKYPHKIITTKVLNTFISKNGTTLEMTEDNFETLSTMLSNKGTVDLGLRMLNSYDLEASAVPIAILLVVNYNTMAQSKEFGTVGTNLIRNKFKFINQNTVYDDISKVNILNYLASTFCKSDKDRELIRSYGMPAVRNILNNSISEVIKNSTFINKYELIVE